MEEATKLGFYYGNEEWSNLGQGAPELGEIPGSIERIKEISMNPIDHSYAPVGGLYELREKIATMYNKAFRKGKKSLYKAENVSVCSGGRLALARTISILDNVNLGYLTPDYSSYEGIMGALHGRNLIPINLKPDEKFKLTPQRLEAEIHDKGINVILASNPTNPTGTVTKGNDLKNIMNIFRKHECSMIFDEFYFNYIYSDQDSLFSAAEFVDDVNTDEVIIISGLTKSWRYPGWRISWTIGPKEIIDSITSIGSSIDGGASRPLQQAALKLVEFDKLKQESKAIKSHFKEKRDYMLTELKKMNFNIDAEPDGAFYIWANLDNMKGELKNATYFFQKALEQKVICVPGYYFDINPKKTRHTTKFQNYVRFSFGPDMKTIVRGMEAIKRVIDKG